MYMAAPDRSRKIMISFVFPMASIKNPIKGLKLQAR